MVVIRFFNNCYNFFNYYLLQNFITQIKTNRKNK